MTALAVPVLLLSACGGDEPEVEDVTPQETVEETTDAEATEEPTDEAAVTEEAPATEEPTTEAPADEEPTTEAPADGGEATEAPGAGGGEGEGGADGQAAADRTKEWLVAFVNAEEAVCDMMLDFDGEAPMKDNKAQYDICIDTFPTQASNMFSPEMAGIIESMEIKGADVQGETAVVDKDNFSPMFAEGIGDQVITLKKIDDAWYVDMNESFN
ncbi:hypothetical protein [Ornithinimicrobium cavernae]|uniref:hypothetical protein n=1 Tax=Ornithinimicrobium cavernae TaxID=2666047 RepID=UPI0012B1724D|nr:hypothetical protein [Ornithinimicrobium cavernae]